MTANDVLDFPRLDGVDLHGVPPCEVLCYARNWDACGNPSVTRVKATCCYTRLIFICAECFEILKARLLLCSRCRHHMKWTEA